MVLPSITATVSTGSRVGLIGEDASGKSTLLRIATGADDNFRSTVDRPRDLGYPPRDVNLPPAATIEKVLHDALAPLHQAVAELGRAAATLDGRDMRDVLALVRADHRRGDGAAQSAGRVEGLACGGTRGDAHWSTLDVPEAWYGCRC